MLGLFTTKAYAEPAAETPLLQRKLQRVLAAEDLIEGSHDYKAAVALFESFPKDELFAAPVEDLRRAVVALLGLHRRAACACSAAATPTAAAPSIIVALPKAATTLALLDRLRELSWRALRGRTVDATRSSARRPRARSISPSTARAAA